MRAELPAIFAGLRALGAPILHYKICSTLDSAPQVGSIGAAAEIGLAGRLGPRSSSPRRRSAAGRPSARSSPARATASTGSTATRRCRCTRSRRWTRPTSAATSPGRPSAHRARRPRRPRRPAAGGPARLGARAGAGIVALDVVDEETLAAAGRLIWQAAAEGPRSSSAPRASSTRSSPPGAPRRAAGRRAAAGARPGRPDRASRARARRSRPSRSPAPEPRGFEAIAVDAARAVDAADSGRGVRPGGEARAGVPRDGALADRRHRARARRSGGRVCDRRGAPRACAGGLRPRSAPASAGCSTAWSATGLPRAVIAGGDTSSHAARALGLVALTAETPVARGARCCAATGRPGAGRLEIALKGGQMGPPDFFVRIRDGGPAAA